MKQRGLYAILAAVFVLVGCGQPAPNGTVVGASTAADTIAGDTVTIDENRYGGSGTYNSSGDGFYSVYFDFDRYDLTSQTEETIARNAANAKRKPGRIRIEGNCDEFGTDEYNYALGLKRAKAVKDAMAAQGVDPRRMTIVSYGESNPVCTQQTETCYRRNRRVDLRLVR